MHDPVTWYGIIFAGTQVTQWDFQNKGTCTSPTRISFVLKVPLCSLCPGLRYSVRCDWIVQRVHSVNLTCLAPRGSCLGSVIVVFYASKLSYVVKDVFPSAHALADDTRIYFSFKSDSQSTQDRTVHVIEKCIVDIRACMDCHLSPVLSW